MLPLNIQIPLTNSNLLINYLDYIATHVRYVA